MPLIERIEASNFLNPGSDDNWTPNFRHIQLRLNHKSSAIVLENGNGKTSLVNAMFAILARDSNMITLTKGRMPPRSVGVYGHVRIEFVLHIPTSAVQGFLIDAGPEVGESWVMGLCGCREDPLSFYYYQGKLEDVPVVEISEAGKKAFVQNDTFRAQLKEARDSEWSPDLQLWNHRVSRMGILPQQLRQMLAFQKAGGGDKSSSLFDVKGSGAYHIGFFYEHVAPQLLARAGGITNDNDELEDKFEDTVMSSAEKFLGARNTLADKRAMLTAAEHSTKALSPAVAAAEEVVKKEAALTEALNQAADASACMKWVLEARLPGLPRWVPSGDTTVDALLQHMVIAPGQGPALRDKGLELLLGKDDKLINRDAERRGIRAPSYAQPVEINWNLKDFGEPGARGEHRKYPEKLYPLDSALAFLDTCSAEYLGVSTSDTLRKSDLKRLVARAFEHFSQQMDTSPFRVRLGGLESRQRTIGEELKQIATTRKERAAEKAKAEGELAEIQRNQEHWETMREAGVPQEALGAPLETEKRFEVERVEADSAKETLIRTLADIKGNKEQWDKFVAQYGPEADPAEICEVLEQSLREKAAQIAQFTQDLSELDQAKKSIREESARLEKERGELSLMRGPWTDFMAEFGPGTDPAEVGANLREDEERQAQDLKAFTKNASTAQAQRKIAEEGRVRLAQQQGTARRDLDALAKVQPGAAYIRQRFAGKNGDEAAAEVLALDNSLRDQVRAAEKAVEAENQALAEEKGRVWTEIGKAQERLKNAETFLDREKKVVAEKHAGHESTIELLRKSFERAQSGFAARKEALEEDLRTLESRKVAPASIAKIALSLIPSNAGYQCLHEAIMASEASPERKKDLITRLSGILFSPVLEDEAAAAELAREYARRKFPILVFQRASLEAFIRSEDAGLLKAVQGAVTENVEMLLYPEKAEAAKQKLRARIAEHAESIQAFTDALSALGRGEEAARVLQMGMAALETAAGRDADLADQDAEEARSAISVVREELVALMAALQAAQEALTSAQAAVQAAEQEAVALLAALKALQNEWVSLDTTFRIRERREALEAVGPAQEKLRQHLAEYGPGSEYDRMLGLCKEFERHGGDPRMEALSAELLSIADGIEKAEAHAAEFQKSYEDAETARREAGERLTEVRGKLSRFDFPKLKAFAESGLRRLDELDQILGRLEEDLGKLDSAIQAAEGGRSRAVELEGEAQRKRNGYDFGVLAAFKAAGGGKELERLQQELDTTNRRLDQLQKWLRLHFKEAERYVRARDQLEPLAAKIQRLGEALDLGEIRREELEAEKGNADDAMLGLKAASRAYDDALCGIVAEFKQFAKIPAEAFGDGIGMGGLALERIRETMGVLQESLGALDSSVDGAAEPAKAIQEQLKEFDLKNVAAKLNSARSTRDRALSSFRGTVESILASSKGFSEVEIQYIRDTMDVPNRIGAIQQKFQQRIEMQMQECIEWAAKVESYRGGVENTLAQLAATGKYNRDLLQRICRKYDQTTFEISVEVAEAESIREGISAIVDLIDNHTKYRKAAGYEDRPGTKKKQDEALVEDVRKLLYETVFINPSIKVRHPQVRGGKLVLLEKPPSISQGQKAALDLMMLVRLAEYAQERGIASMAPQDRKLLRGTEQCFFIIDGLFSSLSKESLIQSALEALAACQGSFQLIGFIHNMSYVNNYAIFPTYLVGKEFSSAETANCRETWVEFESGEDNRIGQIDFFQSTVIAHPGGQADGTVH